MVNTIADVLNQWQSVGVYDFVLPFLLIFAVIFGVLTATNVLGKNKGVHVIVALVIGLLALQAGFVQDFFREIFPRLGVAIAVILVLVILTALFIPDQHRAGWAIGLYSIGGIAFVVVLFNSFNSVSWFNTNWWDSWGSWIVGALLLVGIIIAVSVSSGENSGNKAPAVVPTYTPWRS